MVGLDTFFPKYQASPASCTPRAPAQDASVWAELGELCFLRSRKKTLSARRPDQPGSRAADRHISRPDSRAGIQLSTSSSRAAAVPNQRYRSFR